jgi:hypothetical protein
MSWRVAATEPVASLTVSLAVTSGAVSDTFDSISGELSYGGARLTERSSPVSEGGNIGQ